MTMIGRTYWWDGRVWRVIARWRTPELHDRSAVCDSCGLILAPDGPIFCACVPMPDVRYRLAVRNVLIECVDTGQRISRPFRGLRRTHPEEATTA